MTGAYDDDEPFVYRLNDNGAGPALLIKVCAERGWVGHQAGAERWNLWWRSGAFPIASYRGLGDWQFMNHIPKGGTICRKDGLSRLLRCMRKVHGAVYNFSPASFHLPLEYAKLVSECSRGRGARAGGGGLGQDGGRGQDGGGGDVVWIHKPVAQSQGRGIFLFRSLCELRCGGAAVVQRYIERPLLIAGYKFDLRLYVCVPTYRPLTAYMYAEGLARFGTDKYTLSDIHTPYRHLTNSSLNKTGPRYGECRDRIGNGCKWTLKQLRHALAARRGAGEWLAWQRVRALVSLTLLAQAAGTPPARNCFEFYGFDVLLDDALKPWLLEVNLSPALAADCWADVAVKRGMLHELFDLLGLPVHSGLARLRTPADELPVEEPVEAPSRATRSAGAAAAAAVGAAGATSTAAAAAAAGAAGATSTAGAAAAAGAARRGARPRRRNPVPMHYVNITSSIPDIIPKEVSNGKAAKYAEMSGECAEDQGLMCDAPAGPPPDEWRGGARRRGAAAAWGNGVRWDTAPGRVGNWVRIYPNVAPGHEQPGPADARAGVAQAARLVRAAREVTRDSGATSGGGSGRGAARDAEFEAALREKLDFGAHFQVWLPPY